MAQHTPYQQLTDENIQALLVDPFRPEESPYGPSGYGRLTPPVAGQMSAPPPPPPDDPGYVFEAPGGYAESFAPPGTTPGQYAAAKAGSYSAQRPGLSDQALDMLARAEQGRAQQKRNLETTLAQVATSPGADKNHVAALQAALQTLGQQELLDQLRTEGQAPAHDPYRNMGMTTEATGGGQPTTTTTINPKGQVTTSRRTQPERKSLGERGQEYARAEMLGKAQGLTGPALSAFIGDHMAEYYKKQAVAQAGAPLAPAPGQPDKTIAGAIAGEKTMAGAAPVEIQTKVAAGGNLLRLLDDLENDPGLDKYAFSGQRIVSEGRDMLSGLTLGKIQSDPAYIGFRQKLRQAALTAFDFGGKQLTETEKAFVLATVPSGEERTPTELRTNIAEMKKRLHLVMSLQGKLAGLSKADYETAVAEEIDKYKLGGASTPTKSAVVTVQEITSDPRFRNEPEGKIITKRGKRFRKQGNTAIQVE